VRWTFFEKILSDSMPKNDQGKPLVQIKSTAADNVGVFKPNRLFNHDNLFSVNNKTCLIWGRIGSKEAGLPLTSGYFNSTLPAFEGGEDFVNMDYDYMCQGSSTLKENVTPFQNCENGLGSLDGIFVNTKYLLKVYRGNKTSFNKFIMAALDGINNACGRPWDFQIQCNSNDPTKIAIVDLNVTPNSKHLFGDTGLTYKFKTHMGIIKNVRMTSKLPKGVQAKAYTAASSVNPGEFEGADTFSLYTSGKHPIYDRLTANKKRSVQDEQKEDAADANQKSKDDKEAKVGDKDGYTKSPKYDMLLAAWKSLCYGIEHSMAENKMRDYTEKIIFQNTEDNDFIPAIPIEASFTIDGLAGIYQGNGWELDCVDEGGIMPNRYKNKIAFQTTNVSHKIGPNGWDTEVRGLMRAYEKKKRHYDDDAPTPIKAVNVSGGGGPVNATPGMNGPSSNKSPDALHPIVKAAWLKVEADLKAAGWQPSIVTAFRSLTEQAKKFNQGRSKVTFGNHGAMDENGNRASQALDVIDKRYSYGNSPSSIKSIGKQKTKDKAFLFWGDLGKIAEKHGFTWGGKYSHKGNAYQFNGKPGPPNQMGWDPGHIEMFGRNGAPSTRDNLKNASTALGRSITSKGTNIV